MPRISTDNYDTVASWNGSQDLFIVEQPDGTKVATPAMVKQFIEAGDFVATGEIKDGYGNKLSGVVDIIGDLSQTGITGATVAAQLSQLDDEIDTKQDTLTIVDISSRVTVDTSKVNSFKAYTYGKLLYISLSIKPGVVDQTYLVSGLPSIIPNIGGAYGVLPMFYMNGVDASSNGVCAYAGTQIQYRGSTTQGTSGTVYSGMFLLA